MCLPEKSLRLVPVGRLPRPAAGAGPGDLNTSDEVHASQKRSEGVSETALSAAANAGSLIELDVQLTSDGNLILYQDYTLPEGQRAKV
jgi:hypothetical protein